MFIGHNNGSKYYSDDKLFSLPRVHPLCMLMGCSSLRLGVRHDVISISTGHYLILKGSPLLVGCLWDVSDADLDRMTKKLLEIILV